MLSALNQGWTSTFADTFSAGSDTCFLTTCIPWCFPPEALGQKVHERPHLCRKVTAVRIDGTYRQRRSRIVVQYRLQATRLQRVADQVGWHRDEALPFQCRQEEDGCVVGFQVSRDRHVECLGVGRDEMPGAHV